jgi:hypothetical protein
MKTFKFFAFALALALALVTAAWAMTPVVHHVNAGGPDACGALGFDHPGCNGNFSLSAREYSDGRMLGQYTDRFTQGDGFHAEIDCVSVVGDDAWVSGVITQGTFDGQDLTGQPVATRVRDNGTSANDPPDQISFSWLGDARPCTLHVPYPLLDAPEGQVSVR